MIKKEIFCCRLRFKISIFINKGVSSILPIEPIILELLISLIILLKILLMMFMMLLTKFLLLEILLLMELIYLLVWVSNWITILIRHLLSWLKHIWRLINWLSLDYHLILIPVLFFFMMFFIMLNCCSYSSRCNSLNLLLFTIRLWFNCCLI